MVYHSISESPPLSGTLDIVCPERPIEVKQGECVVSIPGQTGLNGLNFVNSGAEAARTVTVNYETPGIASTGSAKCPVGLSGPHSDGRLSGSSVLSGPAGVFLGTSPDPARLFRSSKYPMKSDIVSGSSNLRWTFGAELQCKPASVESINSEPTVELQQTLAFGSCSGAGIGITIETNGCTFNDYVLNAQGAQFAGGREIRCLGAKKELVFNWGACSISIPAQNFPSGVTYTPGESKGHRQVTTTFELTGVKFTGSKSCAEGVAGTHENGKLSGGWTLRAMEPPYFPEYETGLWIQ
jgi:hypothetical protein